MSVEVAVGRVIVLTSGKGGVGKTTVCAGLGASLAMMGRDVILVDADIGLNNLDMLMGIENKITYDMIDVVEGKCRLKQAIIQDMYIPTLSILPSSHAFDSDAIPQDKFTMLINRLAERYDYVLIDCPAGIEKGFHRAVSASFEAIVVTTSHTSAIRDADKVLTILSSYKKQVTGIIINRARGDLMLRGDMMNVNDMSRLLHSRIIGIIPDDDELIMYSQLGRIMEFETKAGKALRLIARNLESGALHLYDCTQSYRGLIGKIKLFLRRDI